MKIKYFTDEQMKKLYHYFDQQPENPVHILLEILAITGMRLDELNKLLLSDLDKAAWTLTIQKGSKNSESRTCPIGMRLGQRLLEAAEESQIGPHGHVMEILTTKKLLPKSIKEMLRREFDAIKAHIFIGQRLPSIHGFRHTKAKKIYELRPDIYSVKLVMGHKSVTTTERYMTMFNHEKLYGILAER